MNSIIYDDDIITSENDNNQYYYRKFIRKLNKRDCVKFALFCAKIDNPNTKESKLCIKLVEKWLLDENSVTSQELEDAAWNINTTAPTDSTSYAAWTAYYAVNSAHSADAAVTAANAVDYAIRDASAIYYIEDMILYLKTLLRTTKQYNTINHNNQHYESILKAIINEDIDKLTDTDYNMLIDISQEYYNINPNITNKRIFIELLRREYE